MEGKNKLFIPFFFFKGGIINEIPNVLIYAPIKNRFSKLEIEIFPKNTNYMYNVHCSILN